MFVATDHQLPVKFEQDALNPGARGRNGDFKTIGVQVAESTSGETSIPEVPTVVIAPINGKGQVTGSCLLSWPMHDTPAVIDAVMQVQGFSPAKRRAVAGLLNDETDARVDLAFEEPTPVVASYGNFHVHFEQDEAGGVRIQVFVAERLLHSFEHSAEDIAAFRAKNDDASINWARP